MKLTSASRANDTSDSNDATVQEHLLSETTLQPDTSTDPRRSLSLANHEGHPSPTESPLGRSRTRTGRRDQADLLFREHTTSPQHSIDSEPSESQDGSDIEQTSTTPLIDIPDFFDSSIVADTTLPGEKSLPTTNDDALQAWEDLRVRHSQLVDKRVDKATSLEVVRRQRAVVRRQETALVERLVQLVDARAGSDLCDQLAALKAEQREQDGLEDACQKIEDDITYHEWQVGEIESRFYQPSPDSQDRIRMLGVPLAYRREDEDDGYSDSITSVAQLRADPSPEAQQYLSLLGDRNLFWERLDALRNERAALEDERRTRISLGLTLDDNSLEFLDHFDIEHGTLMSQITHIEEILGELRLSTPCREVSNSKSVFVTSASGPAQPPIGYYPGVASLNADEAQAFGPLSSTLLRPFFTHTREVVDMSKFINDWLLYNLWVVEGEKRRYLTTFANAQSTHTDNDLGQHILDNWYSDETAETIVSLQSPGPWSHGGSVRATLHETQRNAAHSDSPPTRRRRNLPLLQTGATTSAADVVARAMQERASSDMTVLW